MRKACILINILVCCLLFIYDTTTATASTVTLNTSEIRIPKGQSRVFDIQTKFNKNTTVLLNLMARMDYNSNAGSNYFMKLKLNGQLISPAKTRSIVRITNRKFVSSVAPNKIAPWFGNDAWRVLYSPNFDSSESVKFYEGNPYITVLDISDMLTSTGTSKLEIINTYPNTTSKSSANTFDLVLKDIALNIKNGKSQMMVQSTIDQTIINTGTPGAGPANYIGEMLPGGGFSVIIDNKHYNFDTSISYPNAGLNKFTSTDIPYHKGQVGFKVTTKQTRDGGTVIADGPDYHIVRTIRFTQRKIEVKDTISNINKHNKLGILYENTIGVIDQNMRIRLAGNPDNTINQYYSPGNPSVYLALPHNKSLGMIIEDDIFRNQATLFYQDDNNSAGFRTDKLCLQPGGTYTLEWSVYPVNSGDYYDFINLVRNDWMANYTVQGAWTIIYPDVIIQTPIEKIREQFTKLGIKRAFTCCGWVNWKENPKKIGFGVDVFEDYWTNFRNNIKIASEKIRKAVPDCKIYAYYNTQRDTSPNNEQKFNDSLIVDAKGFNITTDWDGAYTKTISVVATEKNSFGKAMLSVADRYFSEMNIDGLYWDEMENVDFGRPLITYNVADGYSCELDPQKYTIKREIGINTIMGEAHRLAVIDIIKKHDGSLMGNGPNSTKKILAQHPQRMVEMQNNENLSYEADLGTPLGYAGSSPDFGNWVRALNMAKLLVGTKYDYKYDIQSYIFPFTPIEIHAGYLLGKERIIASHSGNYGWVDSTAIVQIKYFNSDGKLVLKDFNTLINKEARTTVNVEKGEVIILTKLPVNVSPVKGSVLINEVKYDENSCIFTVGPNNGLNVKIKSGKMIILPKQYFDLKVNNDITLVQADDDGLLDINLNSASKSQIVEISVK